MRKLLTMLLVLLAVLVGFVGNGSSMNRPYSHDVINTGGTMDDHPWGGDNSGGGGTTGTTIERPRYYYSTTGFGALDLFFNFVFNGSGYWRHTVHNHRALESTGATTREVNRNIPTTNSAE